MSGRTVLLVPLRCRGCVSSFIPATLEQRTCTRCLDARAGARAATKRRQDGYWRGWRDRQIDAIDTSAAGDPDAGGGAGP